MSYAERAHRWNEWYDGLPDQWRFQVVLWPLLLIGTINMMLTIASGFPFGLLVVLAILVLAVVRLPYKAGRAAHAGDEPSEPPAERTVHLGRVDWAWDLNQRYDAMPEWRRFWIFPAVLIVAGGINMALTLSTGFPFALLFLLALLIMVAIRAPYAWGWLTSPTSTQPRGTRPSEPATSAAVASHLRVAHDTVAPVPALAPIGAAIGAAPVAPEPARTESVHFDPGPLVDNDALPRPEVPHAPDEPSRP